MNHLIKTEIITSYIKERKLTIKQFCEKCKISTHIYYKIMNNRNNFYTDNLFKIAKALELEVCNLFYK